MTSVNVLVLLARPIVCLGIESEPKGTEPAKEAPREVHMQAVAHEFAAALTVALVDAGWSVEANLGEPVRLHRGEDQVEPFSAVAQLFAGEMPRDAWDAWVASHGLGGLMLTPDAAEAAAKKEGPP